MIGARTRVFIGLALAACAAVAQPLAQEPSGGAMKGFSLNSEQPVKIESNALEVRDKIRQATFTGDVKLTQGDTTLKCNTLVVFYADTAMSPGGKGGAQAQKGVVGSGGQQIKRAEAKGNVFVTQKDQTASGENAIYDAKPNTITMTGNVVVTQGPQVMRGERMVVYLTTGVMHVESSKTGGRVEVMMQPGAKDAKPAPPPAPAAPAKAVTPSAKDAKATPISPPAAKTLGPPARIN